MADTTVIRYGSGARFTDATASDGGMHNSPRSAGYSMELPEEFSSLRLRLEYLGRGISLAWCDASLPADVTSRYCVEKAALTFCTFLSGCMEYGLASRIGRKTSAARMHPGDSLFSCHDCEGIANFYARAPYRFVSVVLSPAALENLIAAAGTVLPFPCLPHTIEKGMRLHHASPLTQRTQAVASQIIACPLTEVGRSLFLEGKALELLSLHFNLVLSKHDKRPPLTKSDVERIYAARELLVKNLYDPPSIQKLSALCGLNEFKLKNGFRAYFGDTVHAILVKERMNHALALLRDSDTSVNLVANAVGYSSIGNFIKTFHSQFGVTPGQILKNARRNHPVP
jgi:AraC-like DNA-binding protein